MNRQFFCKLGMTTTAVTTLLVFSGALTPKSIFAATFNDKNAFDLAASAVGTVAMETFDSFTGPVFQLPSLGIKFDPLNNGIQPHSLANTCGGILVSPPNFLINNDACALPGRGNIVFHPNNASNDIIGVGLFNGSSDDSLQLSLFDISNNLIEKTTVLGGSPKFIGIITNNPASRIEISFFGGNGLFAIDNLKIVTKITKPISVPEPSNILGLGLLGLSLAATKVKGVLSKKAKSPTDNPQESDS
jgi:hypothetical protein